MTRGVDQRAAMRQRPRRGGLRRIGDPGCRLLGRGPQRGRIGIEAEDELRAALGDLRGQPVAEQQRRLSAP
jgi:hypothetical protein